MANKYQWDNRSRPSVENSWAGSESLGRKIETMFVRFIQRSVLWVVDFLSDRLVDIFDQAMKIMSPGTERATSAIFDHLLSIPNMPAFWKEMLTQAKNERGESGFILRAAVFAVTIRSLIFGGLEPLQRWANYNADMTVRSFLPDPSTLGFMKHIGIMSEEGYLDSMKKLGLHDKLIPLYIELAKRLPSLGEIIQGKWRGLLSEQEYSDLLKRAGYDDKSIELYKGLIEQFPPLSDILHMMRREAFNDAITQKYGYEEEYPAEVEEFFTKLGIDPKWAKLYYRSEWTTPSPTQGYEMLHRGLIDEATLGDLLKIADFPPFWRDKLMKMSYANYTRVDIRRMYQVGVLSEGEVLEAYKAIGYPQDRAEKLTAFTVQMVTLDERDLTKTDILNLYEEGLTDRGETANNLVKMGYDSNEAEHILKLSDVNIAKAMRTDLINYAKERFLAKELDENGARSELSQIGLKQQSVDRYILNWNRATEIEKAIPPMADIKKWFASDYITEEEFRVYLAQHRHTSENIELYVRQINDQKGAQGNDQAA